MRKLFKSILVGILLFGLCVPVWALEVVRQKNVATYVVFPIMKNDGTLISSATGLDSEIDAFADGAAPDGFADCTNEATEIGSTGQYYLSLAQAETNYQYIIVQVKSTSTGAVTQTILIRTTIGAPANAATTDDGGTINVTTGKIDEVNKLTELDEDNTTIDINGTTVGTASTVTNGVTVTTNNDKTGYALTQAFPANFSALSISATTGLVDITQTAADKVWATAARLLTAGTNIVLAKGVGVTGFNDIAATDVWAAATRTLTAGTNIVLAKGVGITGFNDITVQNVWEYATRTLSAFGFSVTVGTNNDKTGYALSSAGVQAIWDALTSALTTVNSIGKLLVTNINAAISSRSSHSAADVWAVTSRTLSDYSGVWSVSARTITGLTAAALADFFDTNSGTTYASSVAGSVVKEVVDNVIVGAGAQDWTSGERTLIKAALGISDATAVETLTTIMAEIKKTRGR